ncbi:MAG: CPBP family intramembrane metalloprotease [Planctomycetes bacterium]|nr:CPBP family intramembrane metalloprotease [Planctomycetota bacterium]
MDSPAYHAAPMPTPPSAPPPAPQGVPAPPPPPPVSAAPAPRRLLHTAAGFYGITFLFAVGYAVFSGKIGVLLGEETPAPGSLLAALAVGTAIVLVCLAAEKTVPVVSRAADALARLLGPMSARDAVVLALLSGIAEELLFRGALWPHLGLAGTTLLFGLVHVVPRRALLLYPLFATGAGLVLGLLREGSGSVAPPMIAHVLVNGVNLVRLARRPRPTSAPAS